YFFVIFFFSSRRRHTRCYRDWSSDVCSSDLEYLCREVEPSASAQDARCFGQGRIEIGDVLDDTDTHDKIEAAIIIREALHISDRVTGITVRKNGTLVNGDDIDAMQIEQPGLLNQQVYDDATTAAHIQ